MSGVDKRQQRVSDFICRLVGRLVEPAEPLISSQTLESIAAIQIVTFVERAFSIVVEDEELTLRNFDSVNAIVGYVNGKQARPA